MLTQLFLISLSILSMTHGAPVSEIDKEIQTPAQEVKASGDAFGQYMNPGACLQSGDQNMMEVSGCPGESLSSVSQFTPPAVEVQPAPITYTPAPAILQPSPLAMHVTTELQGPAQFAGGEGGQLLGGGQISDLGPVGGGGRGQFQDMGVYGGGEQDGGMDRGGREEKREEIHHTLLLLSA
ncbi:MAG: hypothetical protein DHS80DRAFT_33072 [Piptocephalis tieghemiana]|nr:MAG: hypothetical protein DHS80DRAFT_33072 [Piptocephalis tieghemiana]